MNEAPIFPTRGTATTCPDAPIQIVPSFISYILQPYRQHVQYLKSAQIDYFKGKSFTADGVENCLIQGRGRFEIPESCYIDDTGHFNAVEFNICFNQLAYVLFGMAVAQGIWRNVAQEHERIAALSPSDYRSRQLSSMLIVSLKSDFTRELKTDSFWGELKVERVLSKEKVDFIYTSISFSDLEGVKSTGEVVLAYNPKTGS